MTSSFVLVHRFCTANTVPPFVRTPKSKKKKGGAGLATYVSEEGTYLWFGVWCPIWYPLLQPRTSSDFLSLWKNSPSVFRPVFSSCVQACVQYLEALPSCVCVCALLCFAFAFALLCLFVCLFCECFVLRE